MRDLDHRGDPGTAADRPGGAAHERTLLAWVRTALALAGCALLLARLLDHRHPAAAAVAALLGIAVAAGLLGRASDRVRTGSAGPLPPATALVLATAAASTALAGAALVAVLTAG